MPFIGATTFCPIMSGPMASWSTSMTWWTDDLK
jgi:hypothetical protein